MFKYHSVRLWGIVEIQYNVVELPEKASGPEISDIQTHGGGISDKVKYFWEQNIEGIRRHQELGIASR